MGLLSKLRRPTSVFERKEPSLPSSDALARPSQGPEAQLDYTVGRSANRPDPPANPGMQRARRAAAYKPIQFASQHAERLRTRARLRFGVSLKDFDELAHTYGVGLEPSGAGPVIGAEVLRQAQLLGIDETDLQAARIDPEVAACLRVYVEVARALEG